MNAPLISLVVPTYNIEKYISRMVDSLVNQTYKNLEILLIDDGSTDSSPSICDDWAKKDSRIRVIHKKNEGLGMARNTGLDAAKGEFIFFLDGDDYVDKDMVEKCVENQQKFKSEIVVFGMINEWTNGHITKEPPAKKTDLYLNNDVQELFLPRMIYNNEGFNYAGSASAKMYSIDKLRRESFHYFSEREFVSEDFYSNLFLFAHIQVVSILPVCFYHYCMREQSLTHTFEKNKIEKANHQYECSLEVVKRYGYNEAVTVSINNSYLGGIIGILRVLLSSNISNKKMELYSLLDNQSLVTNCKAIYPSIKSKKQKMFAKAIAQKKKFMAYWLLKLRYRNKDR